MDDSHWRLRLLRMGWWIVLLITGVELAIFGLKKLMGTAPNTVEYLMRYIVWPTLLHGGVLGLTHLLSLACLRRDRYAWQAGIFLTGISAIAMSVAWTHRVVMVSHGVFVLPLIVALLFISRQSLMYTFWLNLGLYGILTGLMIGLPGELDPGFMEVITGLAMLVVAVLVARLVLGRQSALMDDYVHANRKSMLDSLTGLYNHAAFYDALDLHIIEQAKGNGDFCLIVFDIDDFKRINDEYGHDTGDDVLLALVAAINALLEKKDTAYRYGGEEFTVLTPRGPEQSLALAEAIRASFTARAGALLDSRQTTVSAGICQFDSSLFSGRREFFASADEALYEAKRTGKDRAIIWTTRLLERPEHEEGGE